MDQRGFQSSPFQSSSHLTGKGSDLITEVKSVTWKDALKRFRVLDTASPEIGFKPTLHCQPPNAPKPSLKLNEENILFANRSSSSKLLDWGRRISSPNRTRSQLLVDEPEKDVLKTSTPFVRRSSRKHVNEDLLNSALVGAPRLALNSSIHSDGSDPNESDRISPSTSLPNNSSNERSSSSVGLPNTNSGVCTERLSPPLTFTHVQSTQQANTDNTESLQANEVSFNQFRCRICLEEGDVEGALLSPCRCKGTVGLVHRTCLRRWLYESGKPNCELCGYAYIMTPSRRKPTLINITRSLEEDTNFCRDWLNSRTTRRHLLTDFICLILLTPSTYIGVYFCIIGALNFTMDGMIVWQTVGLWCLAFMLIALLTSWMILATRHHVNNFQRYRYYRRRRMHEEAERLAALPRWRFSVQPRPRGSSMLLRSPVETEHETESPTLNGGTGAHRSSSSPYNGMFESVVQPRMIPSVSSERSVSPKLLISVALSAVPEVSEECSNPANDHKGQL